jgi:DNA-directed RNA polymerase specialized sigma24 family protein
MWVFPDLLQESAASVIVSSGATLKSDLKRFAGRGCRVEATISSLIGAAASGDNPAADTLFSTLYSELHRLAKRELARRGGPASLGVTTLLHEAYLDIAGREGNSFPDQARFMGYAARVMRGLIIDHARSRNAIKRGGEFEIRSLKTDVVENPVDQRCPGSTGECRA